MVGSLTLSFELVCLVKIGSKPDCDANGVEARSNTEKSDPPQIRASYQLVADGRSEITGDIVTLDATDTDSSAIELKMSLASSSLSALAVLFLI